MGNQKHGESFEKAVRRFKRKVEAEGIFREVKRRKYYLKPSMKKRVKRAEAEKRRRKLERKQKEKEFEDLKNDVTEMKSMLQKLIEGKDGSH